MSGSGGSRSTSRSACERRRDGGASLYRATGAWRCGRRRGGCRAPRRRRSRRTQRVAHDEIRAASRERWRADRGSSPRVDRHEDLRPGARPAGQPGNIAASERPRLSKPAGKAGKPARSTVGTNEAAHAKATAWPASSRARAMGTRGWKWPKSPMQLNSTRTGRSFLRRGCIPPAEGGGESISMGSSTRNPCRYIPRSSGRRCQGSAAGAVVSRVLRRSLHAGDTPR